MTVRDEAGEHRMEADGADWRRGTTTFPGNTPRPIAARGAWVAKDTYVMTACFYETPFVVTLTARFSADDAQLDLHQNVSFGPAWSFPSASLRGRRE